MKKKQRFLVYTRYVFDGVFDVVAESKEEGTAESPARLWVGHGRKHSQHPAR